MRTWGSVAAAGPAHSRRPTISPADTAASAWSLLSSCSLSAPQHSHTPLQTSYFSLHPSFAFQSCGLIFPNICMYVFMCVHMCFFRGTHLCVSLYVGQRSSSVTVFFFLNNFVYVGVLSVYMSAYCTHACLVPAKRTLALLELELQL